VEERSDDAIGSRAAFERRRKERLVMSWDYGYAKKEVVEGLKPGRYRLKKTITNKSADRRHKDEWLQMPEWKEGWRFDVLPSRMPALEELKELGIDVKRFEIICLENRHPRIKSLIVISSDLKAKLEDQKHPTQEFLAALERADSLRDEFEFCFAERATSASDVADDILYMLVKRHRIALDEVRALFKEWEEDSELHSNDFDNKWRA
jgi:hypothetical protein